MSDFVTALVTQLNAGVFWSTVEALIPWLVVIVPIALGLYFLRRLVKGASKAKVRF